MNQKKISNNYRYLWNILQILLMVLFSFSYRNELNFIFITILSAIQILERNIIYLSFVVYFLLNPHLYVFGIQIELLDIFTHKCSPYNLQAFPFSSFHSIYKYK